MTKHNPYRGDRSDLRFKRRNSTVSAKFKAERQFVVRKYRRLSKAALRRGEDVGSISVPWML